MGQESSKPKLTVTLKNKGKETRGFVETEVFIEISGISFMHYISLYRSEEHTSELQSQR